MKNFCLLIGSVLVLASSTYSQPGDTWGCGERDYKCQLDNRMKALEANPKDPENYYNLGVVFQRSGSYAQAIESYTMYVAIPGVPKNKLAEGYNNRGIAYRATRKSDLAVADYNMAIDLVPGESSFYVNRGNAYVDLKRTDDALANYARAIELSPRSSMAFAQRANLRHRLNQNELALADLAKAIEFDPKYAEPYYTRGVIYSAQKEYAKAILDYDRYIPLISASPAYQADGYMNRGIAHYYTGDPQKAVSDFTKVIELQPTRPNGYLARAMAYKELNKHVLAAADEKKAAELKK